jgi:hypothetical protein
LPTSYPTKDAQIYQGGANSNYGGNTVTRVGWLNNSSREYRALVTFATDQLRESATLRLYHDSASSVEIIGTQMRIYRVLREYVENQVTWNIWATGSNWQTTGAAGALDIDTSQYVDSTVPSTGQWQEWDVTDLYNAAVAAGASEVSFRVSTTIAYASNRYLQYRLREYTGTTWDPQLVTGDVLSVAAPTGITFTSGTAPTTTTSTVTFSRALTYGEAVWSSDAAKWTITDGTVSAVTLNTARTIATLTHTAKAFDELYDITLMDGVTEIASIELPPLSVTAVSPQAMDRVRVTTSRSLTQEQAENTANWTVTGATLSTATRVTDTTTDLTFSADLTPGGSYTVAVGSSDAFPFTGRLLLARPPSGWRWRGDNSTFGRCVLVTNGYIFYTYTAQNDPNTIQTCRVSRFDEATLEFHGDVQVYQYAMYDDAMHYWSEPLLDPTDDKIVITMSGQYIYSGGEQWSPAVIAKSTNAFGGTIEQFTGGSQFTAAELPYITMDAPTQRVLGYNCSAISTNGTVIWFGNARGNVDDRGSHYRMTYWRYRGNGTPKTVAQMVAGGEYVLVADRPAFTDTPKPTPVNEGSSYPTKIVLDGTRVGILWSYVANTLLGTVDNTAHALAWGANYFETDDIDAATVSWKKIDGTALTLPLAGSDEVRLDPVLAALPHWSSVRNSVVYHNDTVRVIAHRAYRDADSDWNIYAHHVMVREWDGTEWTTVHEPLEYTLVGSQPGEISPTALGGYRLIRCDNTTDGAGRYWSGGQYLVSNGTLVFAIDAQALHGGWYQITASEGINLTYATEFDILQRSNQWVVPRNFSDLMGFPPAAPTDVTTYFDDSALTTAWQHVGDTGDGLTGFKVERSIDGGAWTQVFPGGE